jgi:predicted O-linked N-acetylglucosamine transferase (SPINDLY family)
VNAQHQALQRALASLASQRPKDAERDLKTVLKHEPLHAGALNLLGVALMQQQRWEEAESAIRRGISAGVPSETAFYNHGLVLKHLGRSGEAFQAFSRAIEIDASIADCWNNRGTILNDLGRCEDAIRDFDRALALKPNFAGALFNKARSLAQLNRVEDAVAACRRAIDCDPRFADAWAELSALFASLGQYDEVIAACEAALAVDPAMKYMRSHLAHARAHACDWNGLEAEWSRLLTSVRRGECAAVPFALLAMPSSLADQLACARAFVADQWGRAPSPPPLRRNRSPRPRIRVAYVSGDFNDHAVMRVAVGVFEHHDRARFETIAVSLTRNDGSALRGRLESAFERFVDAHARSDREVTGMIRELEIDVAIDLQGYTGARANILAARAAPIQATYVGYPGTSGADFIDYIIGDRIVIPEDQQAFYSEQIVYLPDSYQPNDRNAPISDIPLERSQAGLPETGFVFCSFNNTYKITPAVFDIWMRLLRHVEGSVLWLFEANAACVAHLRAEAQRRGVAPERLVFAPRRPYAEYLASHRLADLFLDTLPYNAHATASAALWGGLPVLTCLGSTFAGRVAASLLHAARLPGLVTASLDEYEGLALKLARDPNLLASLRDRLWQSRLDVPLFDTARTTRHLEAAYTYMYERFQRGQPPQTFAVEPAPTAD